MVYARFETKKNIIFIFSLADWQLSDIFFSDVYSKVFRYCMDNKNKVDKTLKFIEVGETNKFSCVKYSKYFNRFYTVIRKV